MSGKLARTTYRVELDNGETPPYQVEVILADLLRAELEGPKHGITNPQTQSLHTTVLWLWSASLRSGNYEAGFREFKTACTNFEVVKAAGAEVRGVPPTSEGGSDTDSPSPSPETLDTPKPRRRGSSS